MATREGVAATPGMACISETLGERKREVMGKSRRVNGLFNLKGSSWLTPSRVVKLMIEYVGWRGDGDQADLTAVAD